MNRALNLMLIDVMALTYLDNFLGYFAFFVGDILLLSHHVDAFIVKYLIRVKLRSSLFIL